MSTKKEESLAALRKERDFYREDLTTTQRYLDREKLRVERLKSRMQVMVKHIETLGAQLARSLALQEVYLSELKVRTEAEDSTLAAHTKKN